MRIAKICDIEAANAFVPSFLEKFNQKFAKAPQHPDNAHQPILATHNLDRIFCLKHKRQLSKNLTLQYKNITYQIIAERKEYMFRKAEVMVLETQDGKISIEYRGRPLTAVAYHTMQARAEEVSAKELISALAERKPRYKPGRTHPWKRRGRGLSQRAPDLAFC